MRILDRYLLRQFVQTFVICFCSLIGLFVVIDAFNNLDEFLSYSSKGGGLLWVMGEYYAYRVLYFFDRTCGILTLVSAMFTLTWLQRHHELTAIQAAGIPVSRVLKPVVLAVVAIGVLATLNRELLIPAHKDRLSRNAQDLAGTSGRPLSSRFDDETNIVFTGKQAFADGQRIDQPGFLLPPELQRHGKQLTARSARYEPPSGVRPGGYRLIDVSQPRGIDALPSLALGTGAARRTVVFTPRDAPWLGPGECFVVSNVDFEQLAAGPAWRQFSSTGELIAGLNNPSLHFGAEVRVAIHSRIVQPLLDLTLVFLGLPLVLRRDNRQMFLAIGMCLVLVAAFVLVALGCQYLGTLGLLSPALAGWLPLLIFVPCAVALADPLLER